MKIPGSMISEALKRGKADKPEGELDYIRFREDFRTVGRGTVITRDRIIWGYPHIKRIFTLEKGLKRNMDAPLVHAEEKIDGFNVRIASIGGNTYAFSRGGFLDAFVTEKAREMKLERFFADYPGSVLCGEMVGNTPYSKPTKEFDVVLYVFDIDEGDGDYFPCEQRYELLRKYRIKGVPVLGKFKTDDQTGLRKAILGLNKGKKEGMVLKSPDRKQAVKYVTPYSDIEDIEGNSRLFFDMPIGFYYQRVLRSAFFVDDFGLDRKEYAQRLGMAFYEGLGNAVKAAKEGLEIDEEFEILVKDKHIWEDIRKHMSRDVRIEMLWKREENGKTRIRFRKIYKRTTHTLDAYAAGKAITD